MYGAQFKQQVRAGQCTVGTTSTSACGHTIMARALAEHRLQIVCMACRQVRNLARYTRGGYNPDTRVDVIISVMVRITPRVCFAPVIAATAPQTAPCATALCQLLRSACVPGQSAVVAEQRHTQRNLAWSSWLYRVLMIYSCLCCSYVLTTTSGYSDPPSCPCVRAVLDARIPHASGVAGRPGCVQGAALCAPRLPAGHPHRAHQCRAHRQGIPRGAFRV
jgi:hypothetical protein